jgi:hypothetical protein
MINIIAAPVSIAQSVVQRQHESVNKFMRAKLDFETNGEEVLLGNGFYTKSKVYGRVLNISTTKRNLPGDLFRRFPLAPDYNEYAIIDLKSLQVSNTHLGEMFATYGSWAGAVVSMIMLGVTRGKSVFKDKSDTSGEERLIYLIGTLIIPPSIGVFIGYQLGKRKYVNWENVTIDSTQ